MLARNSYPQAYIDACRSRVESQVEAFRALAEATKETRAKTGGFDKTFDALESAFFNNMIIVLDSYFVHRTRALEKNDGNPLNEVRVLANSMMLNEEMMMADSTIKLNVAKSVLKYETGDKIRLNAQDFALIFEAFFLELERKFSAEE